MASYGIFDWFYRIYVYNRRFLFRTGKYDKSKTMYQLENLVERYRLRHLDDPYRIMIKRENLQNNYSNSPELYTELNTIYNSILRFDMDKDFSHKRYEDCSW